MSAPIAINPVDFEENPYDLFTYLKYKGELFTGTLLVENLVIEFKNGHANGRCIEYHDNGQLASDSIYENGMRISGKEWYPDGQLKSDDTHLYDPSGKLIRLEGSWLYPNGSKRNSKGEGEYYLYSSKGELAIKTMINNRGDLKNTNIYYDQVLTQCYEELVLNLYPEFDSFFYNTEYYIWGWVAKKYAMNTAEGIALLRRLAAHKNQSIVRTANVLLGYIDKNEFDPEKYLRNLGYHSTLE